MCTTIFIYVKALACNILSPYLSKLIKSVLMSEKRPNMYLLWPIKKKASIFFILLSLVIFCAVDDSPISSSTVVIKSTSYRVKSPIWNTFDVVEDVNTSKYEVIEARFYSTRAFGKMSKMGSEWEGKSLLVLSSIALVILNLVLEIAAFET